MLLPSDHSSGCPTQAKALSPWLLGLLLGMITLLSGCASSQIFTAANAPDYQVIRGYTPFYILGPMQGSGPDASLPVGTRVKLLSQDAGYSRVMLNDQRTGYIATESIIPAPPLPKESATDLSFDTPSMGGGKKHHGSGSSSPRYTGDQPNDTPLPEANNPPPDLNVGPEEVPAPAATPTPPTEKPKFRY